MTILPWGAGPNILECYVLLFQQVWISSLRNSGLLSLLRHSGFLPVHSCAPIPIDDPMGACNQHEVAFPGSIPSCLLHILVYVNLRPIGTNLYAQPVEMR